MRPERVRTDDYPDLDVSYRRVPGEGVVRHIDGVPEPVVILVGSGPWGRDRELVNRGGRFPLTYAVELGPDGSLRHALPHGAPCRTCGSGPRAGSRTICLPCLRYDPELEPVLRAAGFFDGRAPDPAPQALPGAKPRRADRRGRVRRRGRRKKS